MSTGLKDRVTQPKFAVDRLARSEGGKWERAEGCKYVLQTGGLSGPAMTPPDLGGDGVHQELRAPSNIAPPLFAVIGQP